MTVTPQLVKELRDRTMAGMMDCKKALEACDCDMEKAIVWLREKGIAKAEKKASRVAAEGLCSYVIDGNDCVLFELNSETDFVAKNDKFLALLDKVGQIISASDATNTEEALNITVEGKTLENIILEDSAVIGEKVSLRRVQRITKENSQIFGAYKHMGGRIVVVAVLDNADEVVAKDIAMHIAANQPTYVSQADISEEKLASERQIILTEALNENAKAAKPKPENIIENNIVPGRLQKYLKEICLLDQPFVKNPDETVSVYLSHTKSTVKSFIRLAVGEGIEKEVVDFAAEVAAQAGLNK
ncbi:MAG TPA: elongation factor Ts [Acholeplasmatales bacterium]|jgi:translation elongation factor Ts|nr:MAG: translation elongation factor Ts [Clostridium sp. CAG:307_30_263]CDE26604.1 elongation factor Ts [Clostridium sp. CAG:307]HCS24763.1 elongation factor Ts [Acholeplasmatales bacterium]